LKRLYSILGFLAAILIFLSVSVYVFRNVNLQNLLSDVGPLEAAANVAFGTLYFFSFGVLMKMIYKHHYKQNVSWPDTFQLPFMMHLWTYILPVKGGLVFQTFFMKAKYKLDLSKSFSVGVLVFVASLLITCVVGGILSATLTNVGTIQLLLLFLFGTLLLFLVASRYVTEPGLPEPGFGNSVIRFIQNVLVQFRDQLKDIQLVQKLIAITLVSTLIHAAWFYHCAFILGFHPDVAGITLATVVLRIVTLVRILPGNLGIQELMIGSVFMAAGLGLEEGLTTSLLIRFVSAVLAATFGIAGLYVNFRYFDTDSFSGLFVKLKNSRS
jgi:uncharacterized membrane protein YbhN (UPF0104 family)